MEGKSIPLIRKIITIGRSKAVVLPSSWIQFFEDEYGEPIKEVTIEVNRELRIKPYRGNKNGV